MNRFNDDDLSANSIDLPDDPAIAFKVVCKAPHSSFTEMLTGTPERIAVCVSVNEGLPLRLRHGRSGVVAGRSFICNKRESSAWSRRWYNTCAKRPPPRAHHWPGAPEEVVDIVLHTRPANWLEASERSAGSLSLVT